MSNKASRLDLSAASRLFSVLSCFKRFSLLSNLILSCSIYRSMSYTDRQFNIASKRSCRGSSLGRSPLRARRPGGYQLQAWRLELQPPSGGALVLEAPRALGLGG